MAGYTPLKITGNKTGLVQEREEHLLPDDAYPTLQNAYIYRERIIRKQGVQLLGRLQRSVSVNGNNLVGGQINLIAALGLELTATIAPFTIDIISGGSTYKDPLGNGVLVTTLGPGTGGTINYATGDLVINGGGIQAITGTVEYNPNLPVMGIRVKELQNSQADLTVIFDQSYAYIYSQPSLKFIEWIPGTFWNNVGNPVTATDFFWSTNYWISNDPPFKSTNQKLFWVTNNTGQFGAAADPIRISDGQTWVDFVPPNFGQIDAGPTYLVQCLSFLPYRGRLVCFNTWEGPNFATALHYSNRIRWSTIGNPFIPFSAGPPATGSWRDDIRGQGGFLDIPTSEDIVSVGFVRDNLVIYCERSTWQLRYTGRSIAPFQIERVNSELGGEGPFSAIQHDTSLVGIGDKGIVECDSYKSTRFDIKIPDFVYKIAETNNGPFRVHGIRNFPTRLDYWTVPLAAYKTDPSGNSLPIFPNTRLVYNYENDSWATFNDSFTCLGNYQIQAGRTWLNTHLTWVQCNFPWIDNQPQGAPIILGGNQQGFVEQLDQLNSNDVSLYIAAIQANAPAATRITCPNHNMQNGFVIEISRIPAGTPFDNLNGGVFGVTLVDANTFDLYLYNPAEDVFNIPQQDVPTTPYIGGGLIAIRDNFSVVSKKFNFLDEGQNIQMGYVDILMPSSEPSNPGAISMNVYLDYNDETPSNTLPKNAINDGLANPVPDQFFNSIIPTTSGLLNEVGGTKFWQRVYCPTRANFLTIQYTFSNAQMAGKEQQQQVQIDAQVLWIRRAGRMTQ